MSAKELLQTADWKSEKHVPVIESPDKAKKGEVIEVKVTIGKEIPHPNTTEHHIRRSTIYFLPQGEKFPCELGRFEFSAHGASAQGPNTSTVYTQPAAVCSFKSDKSGTLIAISYCNIHGLWQNFKELAVE
ncbi:MAG: class II SORL domain-containing protein [Candidatus Omnitrophica bacterium]|nr:class II SORL domain-containing protein [Candidatus Omnitrophota bacterium]MBL7151615.1 class II SORL domain-containing protein [Candidatus Omnitrophota bacterium]MBL7210597.1 class II SORL domain-containing protein [Candidatus Omnitrophota bacterium]